MSDAHRSRPLSRRRFTAAAVAALGLAILADWTLRLRAPSPADADRTAADGPDTERARDTLLAFIAAAFGRELSAADAEDLSSRLALFMSADPLGRDCLRFARHLDALAARLRGRAFAALDADSREQVVTEVMRVQPGSFVARLLARISRDRQDFYRMRWSTVPALAWLYRHSAAPWRARGYARWPGVPGDRHEVLVPGAPYP